MSSATPRRSAASTEVEHCRTIVGGGTSADAQLAVFEEAQGRSESRDRALRAVTDWLADATLQSIKRRCLSDWRRSSEARCFYFGGASQLCRRAARSAAAASARACTYSDR